MSELDPHAVLPGAVLTPHAAPAAPRAARALDAARCQALVGSLAWASKVVRDEGTGCDVWIGAKANGYGSIRFDGQTFKAHRVSFVAATGSDVPVGMVLDHTCRNPACVRSAHLRPISNRGNVLAGQSPPADQARRELCGQGHALEGANLRPSDLAKGKRTCLACDRAREAKRSAAISAAHHALGITYAEYRATYGMSVRTAEAIVQRSRLGGAS